MVSILRVVRLKGPLTLASGNHIWATDWFLYEGTEALFDPDLAYSSYSMVNELI